MGSDICSISGIDPKGIVLHIPIKSSGIECSYKDSTQESGLFEAFIENPIYWNSKYFLC